jgi:hypothetical protein
VFVEYAKKGAEDILIKISVNNRGPEAAAIQVLPTLWFRNTWTCWPEPVKPKLEALTDNGAAVIGASHPQLGERFLYCEGDAQLLFTENETNNERLFGTANTGPYVKDGINDYVVGGKQDAVYPGKVGTKAAALYRMTIGPRETATIRLRLGTLALAGIGDRFRTFDAVMQARKDEADIFYQSITPENVTEDEARVMRSGSIPGMPRGIWLSIL